MKLGFFSGYNIFSKLILQYFMDKMTILLLNSVFFLLEFSELVPCNLILFQKYSIDEFLNV